MKDNIIVIMEYLLEKLRGRSKKFYGVMLAMALSVVFAAYTFVPRIPNGVICTWEAKVTYSLPSERWRFNWLMDNTNPNQCQRLNHKGDWLPMNEVSDSGVSDDTE